MDPSAASDGAWGSDGDMTGRATEPESWVRRYGTDPIACSTLQPGLRRMETPLGYIAHRRVLGTNITLGPPVCAPSDRAELLRTFLHRHRRPLLCYVDAQLLHELARCDRPLHAAGMGVDKLVDIPALLREPARPIASAVRKARRAGVRLEELQLDGLDPSLRGRIDEITRSFLARSQVPVEMSFLNRPLSLQPDGLRRVFLLRADPPLGVFGYVVLNPWFEDGQVAGYLLDIIRFERTRLWGVYLSTVFALAEHLAAEGRKLSLGYCPLWQIVDPPVAGSSVLQAQMRWMERSLHAVEYVQRLREMKSLVPGPVRPRFFASHSRSAVTAVAALVSACGVPLRMIFGPALLRAIARSRETTPGAHHAA